MNPVELRLIYPLPLEVKREICCISCQRPPIDVFVEGVAVCENGHLLCSSYARQFPLCPGTKFKECGTRLAICRFKWLETLFGPPHFLEEAEDEVLFVSKNKHSIQDELSFSDSSNDEASLEEPELSAEEEKPTLQMSSTSGDSGLQNCRCYPLLKDLLKRQELVVGGNRKIRGNEQPQHWISMTQVTYLSLFHKISLPAIEFHRHCEKERKRSKSRTRSPQRKHTDKKNTNTEYEYGQKRKNRNNWEA